MDEDEGALAYRISNAGTLLCASLLGSLQVNHLLLLYCQRRSQLDCAT